MGCAPAVDFLIVGAGVFGVSTALYLAETEPSARIVLVDHTGRTSPAAASSDVNKIVRADYDDIFYMRLAVEAVEAWRHHKLYQPFYHQTGMLFAAKTQQGRQILENYKTLGVETDALILSPNEARKKFPCFAQANWDGVSENYYNPGSGWAQADDALHAAFHAALDAGVGVLAATVAALQFDAASGECTGIRTTAGPTLAARHTLLCTGAGTAPLLADSAPTRRALHVGSRLVAAAATSCVVACAPEHRARYRGAPVHFVGMPHTRGEAVPLDPQNRLKFNLEFTVTHRQLHAASEQSISIPPAGEKSTTWTPRNGVPRELRRAVRRVVQNMYGADAPGLKVESYRLCWDAVTPNQDFLITPHPACRRLFVATGGSFHGWKFLPVIGKYIAKMMKGELEEEYAKRWAWDRPNEGAACSMYIPQKDLKDFDTASA